MYESTFVRYERRGDRVVPVRVTKAWVSTERKPMDTRKAPTVVRAFKAVRVTELRKFPAADGWDDEECRNYPRREWPANKVDRVESRERLFTLCDAEGEQVVREAGYDQCWLPYSVPANPTLAQANWTLANGNGWIQPEEA